MLRARGIKDRAITNHLQNQVMDNPDMVRMNQTL